MGRWVGGSVTVPKYCKLLESPGKYSELQYLYVALEEHCHCLALNRKTINNFYSVDTGERFSYKTLVL